jgi:NitT/TauT family transport system substrate-binding protein
MSDSTKTTGRLERLRIIVGLLVTRRLLNYSPTSITVAGTLAVSVGANLLTNLWSSPHGTVFDLITISIAIAFVYVGYILFRFLEDSRRWSLIADTEEDVTLLASMKEKFVEARVGMDYNKKSVAHLCFCTLPFALALLLSVYKIGKEWSMLKLKFFSVALAFCSLIGCSSNQVTQPSSASIGYQEIALSRHLFTAKEKGFFEAEGVNVDIKPIVSANRLMEAMLAAQLDGAALINLQVALTIEGKDPNRVKLVNLQVWNEKSFPDYILVRSATKIKSINQLEGHTVGLHPGSAVKAFSRTVFQHFNVNVDKISFIELDPAQMQAAVTAGRVDAVYAMDPAATTLIESGLCHVLVANPMQYIFNPPVPISGTVLSTKFLREHPQEAQKIIKAFDRAIIYMREPGHEEEIAAYIAKYTPISKEMALKLNPSEYWTQSEIQLSRVQALADRFQGLGIIEKKVDVMSILLPASNPGTENTNKQ